MVLFPTYNRFPLSVQSATGAEITDINGKTYVDFGSGIGVCNLGHCHPIVQKAVEKQLHLYWHTSNLYENPIQSEVAAQITTHSHGDYVFFCNSGAEANEAAIKLARKVTGKETIITFQQSFHGRTFATMAATGQEKVREGFGPMLEKFAYAIFNDLASVEQLIDENTAAVMVEVVQGEGGVHPADHEFIEGVATLCKENNILLIVDEIQTGIGRTGKKFGFEHYQIEPDIFTLAKGLGNGLPVGAMVAKAAYKDHFGPGSHGSTFGGNPLAMASANAVLQIVFEDAFLDEVEAKASYLQEKLEKEIAPLASVQAIRQKGMMVGIDCDKSVAPIVTQLLEKGLLVLSAGDTVVRLLPPLIVTEAQIDEAIELLKVALATF
ncbi:MAG TPA: acetylornithine transaminase [Candidatus Pseudogracilibacillus intestinigallinarum]|uniref:Acetylornithine aminotransferase n=1 Tax=Candidatus Pseudogracilibacillus intestinigallinarum TaxID=2838742 RepID=A0A9D1PK58_9BACI|nr:acetylornithine transaminase [Candidatus Pseudogracilibacillus intestinigallinarum]